MLVIKLESGLGSKGLNYAGLNSKPDDLSLINNHYNSLAISYMAVCIIYKIR